MQSSLVTTNTAFGHLGPRTGKMGVSQSPAITGIGMESYKHSVLVSLISKKHKKTKPTNTIIRLTVEEAGEKSSKHIQPGV